jgi:aminopeptidase N
VGFESIPHNLGKTWFPCVDNFTDRASYDLFATVENDKTAVGSGLLVETIDNGDNTTTWHWKLSHPVPTYLQSVAISDYVLYEDVFEGMEADIPIQIYTRQAQADKVAGSFVHLHEILTFFEEKFGPYPFERIGYVATAIGAMEHATNIAYPYFAINGNTSYESLLVHELSHMWFGDKVTCSSAEDMWLNEGWATFCELYYVTELYSEESFITEMRTMHNDVLKKAHIDDNGFWPLNDIPQEETYGKTAYDKGGTVVNSLRAYLGDSLFSDALTAYLDEFAYQSASSFDMRDFLSAYTGIDMDGFFENWVFTAGTPHFSIDSTRITAGDASYLVDIYMKQKRYGFDYIGTDQVVHIAFVDEELNLIRDTIHFSGETGHSAKILEFDPIAVLVDPYETTNDATIDNYKFFNEVEEYSFPKTMFKLLIQDIFDSVLIQVTHHFVAPDSLKIPVEGLKISQNHYWDVNGALSEEFHAQGRFFYDSFSELDSDLIQNENDSVVIFFRSHPQNEWQYVSQSRVGNWNIGYIYTDEVLLGQYTLAVWDKEIVGEKEVVKADQKVKFYPNPTRNKLHVEFENRGDYAIRFYREDGTLLKILKTSGKKVSWKWESSDIISGLLVAEVFEDGKKFATERILIIK